MRKNKKSSTLKNKKMDNRVYNLRRQVMKFIYEAKEIVTLPYVDVRSTDDHRSILGQARLNDNIIWITEETITSSKYDLRTIVYHELLHAVYGITHHDNCPLMNPTPQPLSKTECQALFKKWAS